MNRFLRDYFSFNKKERNGIAVLLFLLAILIACLIGLRNEGTHIQDKDWVVRQWAAPVKPREIAKGDSLRDGGSSGYSPEKKEQVHAFFYFDPNRMAEKDWIKLGLPERLSRTLSHYASKGGIFRKKEDLKKIYGLSPKQYCDLEPFIRIPSDSVRQQSVAFPPKKDPVPTACPKISPSEHIELNAADSAALVSLPCIGPSFARRIIIYRNRLGGFISERQLLEVYGFDEERLKCMGDRLVISLEKISRININSASAEELKKHPYFNWNLAKLVVSYRKQHGVYHTLDELKSLQLMDSTLFRRVVPYLGL
jgi:competence protein ComEA